MEDTRPIVRWEKKLSTVYIAQIWEKAMEALKTAGKDDQYHSMQKDIENQNYREMIELMKKYVKFEGPYISDQQAKCRR